MIPWTVSLLTVFAVVVIPLAAVVGLFELGLWTIRRARTAIRRRRLRDFPELQAYAEHITIGRRR